MLTNALELLASNPELFTQIRFIGGVMLAGIATLGLAMGSSVLGPTLLLSSMG